MTTFYNQFYKWNDHGMPYMSAIDGMVLDVMDACLVNGLPMLPLASLTRSGSTVTATVTGNAPVNMQHIYHFEGTNGAVTTQEALYKRNNFKFFGAAAISTAQAKFGSSSFACTTSSDYGQIAGFTYNTSVPSTFEYTCWFYPTTNSVGGDGMWILANTTSTATLLGVNGLFSLRFSPAGDGKIKLVIDNNNNATSAAALTLNTWHHIAISKTGTSVQVWVDGTAVISVTANNTTYSVATGLYFGKVPGAYFDELTAMLGSVVYGGGSTFTPPSSAYSYTPLIGNVETGWYVNIAGANETQYNGLQGPITLVSASATQVVFTFPISTTPASPATGTLTWGRAGLQWLKPFSGVNKAVYQSQDYASNRFYLQVLNDRASAASTATVNFRGYESMSDVDTGVNAFPTVAGISNLYLRTNVSGANTNCDSIQFALFGDGKTFFIQASVLQAAYDIYMMGFGYFISSVPGDGYNTFIGAIYGAISQNSALPSFNSTSIITNFTANWIQANVGLFIARPYSQLGACNGRAALSSFTALGTSGGGSNNYAWGTGNAGNVLQTPGGGDGNMYLLPIYVLEGGVSNAAQITMRGRMPGWYAPLAAPSITNFQEFPGVSGMTSGTTALGLTYCSGANIGSLFIDKNGPWV